MDIFVWVCDVLDLAMGILSMIIFVWMLLRFHVWVVIWGLIFFLDEFNHLFAQDMGEMMLEFNQQMNHYVCLVGGIDG